MVLVLDIGNTNIVVGYMESESNVVFAERLSTDTKKTAVEHAVSIKNLLEIYGLSSEHLEGAIISSVVPPITSVVKEAIFKVTGLEALVVGPGVKNGLHIKTDNPAQVGSDLIVDAVAAIHEYSVPLIIIDMGTATTISVVDEDKSYAGTIIIPGVNTSLEALVSGASQLSKISLEAPKRLVGKNTIESMKSGIIHGNAACLDGMIDRIEKELGKPATVVATGGISNVIVPHCTHKIILDDVLLLKGLFLIYQKNKA